MRFVYYTSFILVILLSSPCSAGTEKADFRWTIGYESVGYDSGITLRRYFGENWEVYIGGGPNDSKRDETLLRYSFSDDGTSELTDDDHDSDKSEEGFVYLGVGRKVIDADRFVMTGTLGVKYRWRNFQDRDFNEDIERERIYIREYIGHNMTTEVYLGLRPSYDITPRIALALNFGIYYSHYTQTKDDWEDVYEFGHNSNKTTRTSANSSSIGIFNTHNLYSMLFMFRF